MPLERSPKSKTVYPDLYDRSLIELERVYFCLLVRHWNSPIFYIMSLLRLYSVVFKCFSMLLYKLGFMTKKLFSLQRHFIDAALDALKRRASYPKHCPSISYATFLPSISTATCPF